MHECNAEVIVHTVLEVGELSDLKRILDDPKKKLGLGARMRVWSTIRQKLTMESHRFTENDLTLLDSMWKAELARLPEPPPRHRGIRGIRRAG